MKQIHAKAFLLLLFVFLTAACSVNQEQSLHLAFLTDLHITPGGESSEQLSWLVQEINEGDFDMVVVTGDISNRGSYEELINVKKILDELIIPYHMLPGNHETNWSESASRDFLKLWCDDKFMFRKGTFLFAGLNTGPFMRMGDGHVKKEDMAWLEQALTSELKRGDQLLFFAHYPLSEGLDQWYEITDILNQHKNPLAFCGHGHRLQLLNFDGIPGIMGRSMVYRGENIPGYNIVTIRNDSLLVYDKVFGEEAGEPAFAFYIADSERVLADLDMYPRPDFSINQTYDHVASVFYYEDQSSVFTGPLLVGDTMLVFGNSSGELKALDIRTKEAFWQHQLSGPLYATPVQEQDLIITGDLSGFLYAFHAASGEVAWWLETGGPVLADGLIEDGYYYGGAGTEGFYKIDIEKGKAVWHYDAVPGLIQAQAALSPDYVVFTAWDTHVYCLDKNEGSLVWKWNNRSPVVLFSPGNVVPVISNGKVFIVAPDRYMTALDLESGRELWRTNRHMVRESMGVSEDGQTIFAKLMNDSIVAISAKPGHVNTKWALDAGFGYDHNPCPIVVQDDMLFAATRNGLVIAVDISSREVAWKHKVGNSAVNKMHAGPDNTLWFTTADGRVVSLQY
ncbi:MAG: PQQ-binding-like beta-propeller repeat protein [Bacteroidales bacterium]|nr:PQQ-binding-like beta-propeller repeat protein [Bacteroidales bacterium]